MAREKENEAMDREAYRKGGAESTETLNEYYYRKQSVKETELAPEAEIAGPDRDAETEHYPNQDAGPRNTTPMPRSRRSP